MLLAAVLSLNVLLVPACLVEDEAVHDATEMARRPAAKAAEELIAPTYLNLEKIDGLPGTFTFVVPVEGTEVELDLVHRPIRDRGCLVLRQSERRLKPILGLPSCTYRGVIRNQPGSLVAVSIRNGLIEGMISTASGKRLFIQPMDGKGTNHVLHAGSRRDREDLCILPVQDGAWSEEHDGGLAGEDSATRTLRLGVDTDQELYALNNSSTLETIHDIESVINVTSAVYEEDIGLRIFLGLIVIRTDASNPYDGQTALELLCNMTDIWNQGSYPGLQSFDALQLMTGRVLEGAIGTAFVSSICQGPVSACGSYSTFWPTSVVETRYSDFFDFRVALSAHEIGHGLGASHCTGGGCHIMCPAIGQCGGASGVNLGFGTISSLTIDSYVQGASCLPQSDAALEPQIVEDFEVDELDRSLWLQTINAETSYIGMQEPGGSRSLLLHVPNNSNGDGSNSDIPAICTTTAIGLENHVDGTISFWAQHFDYYNDDNHLDVEYLNNDGHWITLMRIEPEQVSSNWFTRFSTELPADAFWDGFHLRFKAKLNMDGYEFWAIDLLELDATALSGPVNDDCRAPRMLETGLQEFTTTEASDSPRGPDDTCESIGIRADVWYEHTATCDGRLRITTCGLVDFEAVFAAYEPNDACDVNPMVPLACSSDDASYCSSAYGTELTAMVKEGQVILLRIGSADGSTGSGYIFTECTPMEEPACPADLDGNGIVDGGDLATLLSGWNTPDWDLDGDEMVDGTDLATMLGMWGPCPEG